MSQHRRSNTDVTGQSLFPVEWKRRFRRRMLAWFSRHARDLPWRDNRDPYRVWISEIMLQQTQVATVRPYFERFIAAFPDVQSLAEAEEEQVLRLWEGLGYYRRARQLHQAAREISDRHGGQFPSDAVALRSLPGIGRYTAGAIASIAFDARQPILEANTTRLFSRLLACEGDPGQASTQRTLWQAAEEVLPRKNVGAFNQALMELGSEVCTPRLPKCDNCPIFELCAAFAGGRQEEIPLARKKPPTEAVTEAAVVVYRRGKVLLVRQDEGGRWAGLWDFPRFPLPQQQSDDPERALIAGVLSLTGVTVDRTKHLTTLRHGVTRFRITLHCHTARYRQGTRRNGSDCELRWLRPTELEPLPLNTTGRKLSRLILAQSSIV